MNIRLHRSGVVLLAGLGISALAWPVLHVSAPRIVYNPSDSVPRGWYRIDPPNALHVGEHRARPPAGGSRRAGRAASATCPRRIPLLKRIGAMSPQQVCIEKHIVRIDGTPEADRPHSRMAVAVHCPAWQQCRRLQRWRAVPAQCDESGIVRQPVLRSHCCLRRDRQRAAVMDVGNAMIVQRSLPFFGRSHCASLAPQPAVAVLHPCRQSQPDRRSRSRQRSEKTEGKIKGRGTSSRRKPCLHVGWRGTRFVNGNVPCAARSPRQH
jgi:type IV secretory pathway protease TraF